MKDRRGDLLGFLHGRGIHCVGFEENVSPTAQDAWRYTARDSVTLLDRIPVDDIKRLESTFHRAAEMLSLFSRMPVLLSVSGFGCPWARVELLDPASVIEKISIYPDDPRFILASEISRKILAVDSQEWGFLLIAAQWTDDGLFVPITESDL